MRWQAKSLIRTKPPAVAGAGGKDEGMAAMMNKQMLYFYAADDRGGGHQPAGRLDPVLVFSTLLTGLQQMLLFKKANRKRIKRGRN